METKERVRILKTEVLSDDWYVLRKVTFDFQRRDGAWQRQSRETYDRGNGATILLRDRKTGNVLLTRQFRMPAFVNGHDGMLIETPGGLLDDATPEERIRVEVEEETGYRVHHVEKIFEAFMSPGSVTEKLYFYIGDYDGSMRVSAGGGVEEEGEEIETIEVPLQTAMQMIERGEIMDGKTIMLLQYAALKARSGE
ncbi:NUDIX domain-containing protein [Caballeronia novacaledonica]|jgi:nudix-type nucleoside diphosphatase (YffH/AdpP family)|uniref:NUDIX domain-containing protein n=2 Tax=Caballeronia novacaledonica TaxID=1544861 RepID=A0ACB5QP39_9BURK|nr:NUDIX domain-containing protein [Caballeronia novacaledonica]GJH12890.1 NUDIX domain-containing protein [Caballeronia novacaledonica]GJH16662.1 NUDIX domain-containing protein [Caballeronia novacaledonica]GJH24387.1 NUDIX domain-containing protein [Caballeronia novacaledonica]